MCPAFFLFFHGTRRASLIVALRHTLVSILHNAHSIENPLLYTFSLQMTMTPGKVNRTLSQAQPLSEKNSVNSMEVS